MRSLLSLFSVSTLIVQALSVPQERHVLQERYEFSADYLKQQAALTVGAWKEMGVVVYHSEYCAEKTEMKDDPDHPEGLIKAADSVGVKINFKNPGSFRVIAPVANRAFANFLQIHGIAEKIEKPTSSSASASASATAATGYPSAGPAYPSNGQPMATQSPEGAAPINGQPMAAQPSYGVAPVNGQPGAAQSSYGAPATNGQPVQGQAAVPGGTQPMNQQAVAASSLQQPQQYPPQNPQSPGYSSNGQPATQQYGASDPSIQQTSSYSSTGQQPVIPNPGMAPANQPMPQGYGPSIAQANPNGAPQAQAQVNSVANPSQPQSYGTNTQQTYGGAQAVPVAQPVQGGGGLGRRDMLDKMEHALGIGGDKTTTAEAGPTATASPSDPANSNNTSGAGDHPVIAQQPWLLPPPPGIPQIPNPCIKVGMIFPTANPMVCVSFKPLMLSDYNPNKTIIITEIMWRNVPASQLEKAVQGEEIPMDTNAPALPLANVNSIACKPRMNPGMGSMPGMGGMGGTMPGMGMSGMPGASMSGGLPGSMPGSPPIKRLKRRVLNYVSWESGEKG